MSKRRWVDRWVIARESEGWFLTGLDRYRRQPVRVQVKYRQGWERAHDRRQFYRVVGVDNRDYVLGHKASAP